jgi:hypothetical protein
MPDYREHSGKIEVPRNTGIDGLLFAVRELLKRPRIQAINIDAKGQISYKRYVREDEADVNIGIDFDTYTPASIIRNSEVSELQAVGNAAVVLGSLFSAASVDQLHPIALVSGAATKLWEWYRSTTNSSLPRTAEVFGLPFLLDRGIPDTALLLCTAYGKDSAVVDTVKVYKVEMEVHLTLPTTHVEII